MTAHSDLPQDEEQLRTLQAALQKQLADEERRLDPLRSRLSAVTNALNRLRDQAVGPIAVGDRVFINGHDSYATSYTWATVRSIGPTYIHVHVDGDSGLYTSREKQRRVYPREVLLVNPPEPVWIATPSEAPNRREYYVADGFVAEVRGASRGDEYDRGPSGYSWEPKAEAFLDVGDGSAFGQAERIASGSREAMRAMAEELYRQWAARGQWPRGAPSLDA